MTDIFSDLLNMAKEQPEPQRLLFLFADPQGNKKPQDMNDKNPQRGTIEPKMCVDKLLSELSDFQALVKEADSIQPEWEFVFIAGLSGSNGKPPTSEDADPYLNQMTHDVTLGKNIAKYIVLNRKGDPIELLVN